MSPEIDEKTQRLISMLEHEGIDGVLLNAHHNFAWLTGGGSNGVDTNRENGVASVLVDRRGKRHILANNIELERMLCEQISANDFIPVEYRWQDEKADASLVIKKANSVLGIGRVLATDIQLDADTQAIETKVAPCRYQLTKQELKRIRDLGRDAGHAMGCAIASLVPGESEIAIAEKLRAELGRRAMTSVVTLIAADDRIRRFRHPLPTSEGWKNLLLLVTCAKRGGLIVSLSRMVCSGEIPDELRFRTEAAAFVNARLIFATQSGKSGKELYKVAEEAYAERGFPNEIDRHHQGGATGYKTRDWVAHPNSVEVVMLDQAFAWNPSITGTKVEETGIVTSAGFEVITETPNFPYITVSIDGKDLRSPGIFSLSKGATA